MVSVVVGQVHVFCVDIIISTLPNYGIVDIMN